MRRLVVLVASIVLLDTMLYAALTPLLPDFVERFDLSKTGAGLLVASYAIGVLAGAVPAGFASARLGAKPAALAGLLVMGVASVGFAYADSAWGLGIARFVQGLGSALSWAGGLAWLIGAAPRSRRGELLGTALGAAIVGALLGPVLGGVASVVGRARCVRRRRPGHRRRRPDRRAGAGDSARGIVDGRHRAGGCATRVSSSASG